MTGGTDVAVTPPWRVLLGYVRPYWRALLVGGVLSVATAATGLALPLVVRGLIDNLSEQRGVTGVLGLMTVLIVANAAIGALGSYVLARAGESVVRTVRRRLTARLIRLRLSAIEQSEPGDLMSRVTADTTLLREVTTNSLVSAVTGLLTLVATLVLMGVLDLTLLGVTLAVIVTAGLVIGLVLPRINAASKRTQEAVGVMGAALERAFGAFRTLKASGAEQREGARIEAAAEQAWRAGLSAAKWEAAAGNTVGLAVQAAILVVLAVGGARVAEGAIDVGTLVAFLLYLFYLMAPISGLVSAATSYQVGSAAVARIQEVERLPIESEHESGAATRPDVRRDAPLSITFERVSFRYAADLPAVHDDVTFTVPAGGMTAFVGPSGAGKTTVFSLIERFYQPDAGRVLVDGTDVAQWSLGALRSVIGYVEQDSPVLSGSLRENLLFAAPDADEESLHRVVRTARLDALIAGLPAGLDTTVGHRGMKLSGGERQRVAIARALLRRPAVLLLDEATSALDAVNEGALRDTIADVARTTTVLVVAHRLSTVTRADRIVVLERGRVRAIGTHAVLIASDRLYAELASSQLLAPAG